jgi:diguanylate cyclase (GGDEF)-like protein/PAS domain S-box-containing protein
MSAENIDDVISENQRLWERKEELEETLRAIRCGEVDALVAPGPEGDQLFILKGALDAYRVMVEAMSDGAVTLTREGTILYCNECFAGMAGIPHSQVVGMSFRDMVAEHERRRFGEMLAQSLQGAVRNEILLQAADGKPTPVYLSMHNLPGSENRAIAVVVTDLAGAAEAAETKSLLAAIVESSEDAIISTTLDGLVLSWNPAAEKLFGYSAAEASNASLNTLIGPAERGGLVTPDMETVRLHKDGSPIAVSIVTSPIFDAKQTVVGASINLRDISERIKNQKQIQHLNRVYAVLSGINMLIVRAHNREELLSEACRIAVETGGFRSAMICIAEPQTHKVVSITSAGKDNELLAKIKSTLASEEESSQTMIAWAIREQQTVVSNNSVNDTRFVFATKYAEHGIRSIAVLPLIVADEAVGALALYSKETAFFHEEELKLLTELADDVVFAMDHLNKQEKINYLAYYDTLTGLANRSLFIERLTQHMRAAASEGNKLAVVIINPERFKNINESFGREAGDELLQMFAAWLAHDRGDVTLLARIEADHFAMVVPSLCHESGLLELMENMELALSTHRFHLNGSDLSISVKCGITVFPDDGDDASGLLVKAEAALNKTMKSAERFLFYAQSMTEVVADKLSMENMLREAIVNEEFVLHYQPKVNLESGEITGAEALIRWNSPVTGLVPPDQFIPILEETGLIHEVGRWALQKAIADNLSWRDTGLPAMRIAVNVSALQLRREDFIHVIERVISNHPRAAEGLELEITESLAMERVKDTTPVLEAIRAMGITIAIDDFGTGFSSLGYLAKLPVTTLKIDRAFVTDMTNGKKGMALVSSIINLAHTLGLKVVAEGVETEEQSRLLSLLNCDEIQGFLFSKALTRAEFEQKVLESTLSKKNRGTLEDQ